MVQGIPYVHWKIKDMVDLTEIDPVYLWGTIVETDKGPLDTPVFCTNADQVKKIFNYDLRPFFVNGGQSVVIVRAYAGTPKKASFEIKLNEDFSYPYVDYDYYDEDGDEVKGKINVDTQTLNSRYPKAFSTKYQIGQGSAPEGATVCDVTFDAGRWRICDENGIISKFYEENGTIKQAVSHKNITTEEIEYYPVGTTDFTTEALINEDEIELFTKAFNDSDVTKIIITKLQQISANTPLIKLETVYPGDFQIPISILKDIRAGYRISINESDDYTIMLSGVTKLSDIVKKINERANNIKATLTDAGKLVEAPFVASSLVPTKDETEELPEPTNNNMPRYTLFAQRNKIAVGSIFAKRTETEDESANYEFKLIETTTTLAEGDNGKWNDKLHRIADPSSLRNRQTIATAHKEALDHLASIKLAGIFCNYGEDEVQKVYADHVSTTEPQGMNSTEVCRWRSLILGANAFDREDKEGYNLVDKAVSLDNESILFLGQGLVDDGFEPASNVMKKTSDMIVRPEYENDTYVPLLAEDFGALPNQLLPFQCTQYIAGLRSKLFYGDAIFGGEAKKEIRGVGSLSIAPLFTGENKILWQPDAYVNLNQHGILTFTTDYNYLTLTDGVTTRQSPLEEDEEGVQNIIKYAKHAVHEELQTFIGRNLTDDLQIIMENSVKGILSLMQTQDQTLVPIASEGLAAYDVNIVLVPKTNAQQLLAKAYVYLTLTPVHALRQIEVELTVQ